MNALPALEQRSTLEPSTAFDPPLDWPGPGRIDLELQDLPHASATLEWWYSNCHLRTGDGRDLSLFAAFFRERAGVDPKTEAPIYAHSVAWAMSEPACARYAAKVAVDSVAPALGLAKLEAAGHATSSRIDRALREVFERGKIPLPTQLLPAPVLVDRGALSLDYGGDRLVKAGPQLYELSLYDSRTQIGCRLEFVPKKAVVRYGADGVVHGVHDETMFYYFIPRCEVTGQLIVDGQLSAVESGSGWFDHEFGVSPKSKPTLRAVQSKEDTHTAWRWVSLQLDNGYDLSIFIISRPSTGEILDNWCLLIDREGNSRAYPGVKLRETETWRSTRSFVSYPIAFALDLPEARLSLRVRAAFPDQEVLTIISDPGFWEGRVDAQGVLSGASFAGKGWVECKGFRFAEIDGFLGAVGAEVRRRLSELLPSDPSEADLPRCIVRGGGGALSPERYTTGVEPALLARGLTRPILEVAMRGGKAWRSYAALACIDVVGGDSRKFQHWMPMPELLHVGSLIVDDVEDGSVVRRGGPACHIEFGRAIAINAGTAAYFLAEPPLLHDPLPLESKLEIYHFYFEALRAGHAGQALDLLGHDAEARLCVREGNIHRLEQQVLAVHRLKTAVPAGMLARIGAVLGGGSEAQVEALGQFFEALGLAFQILDDVLDSRGFENDLKERGEDVRQGKVTLPIVKAMERLPQAAREWLYQTLSARRGDARQIQRVISLLESIGALDACVEQARSLVDSAWTALDPVLEDSQYKLMLRAFSQYILERHY